MVLKEKNIFNIRDSIESIVAPKLRKVIKIEKDIEKEYLKIQAPNIIEFVHSPNYLNIPSIYKHKRQYQVLRDIFQCRCPVCNPMTADAIDCWNKTLRQLKEEVLLIWSQDKNDMMCPKCDSTYKELAEEGALQRYNQANLIIGMRCVPGDTRIVTKTGMKKISTLWKGHKKQDTFNPIQLDIFNGTKFEPASDIYYAGKAQSLCVTVTKNIIIEGSKIHPVQAIKDNKAGWYKLEELSIGDKIKIVAGWWPSIENVPIQNSKIMANNIKWVPEFIWHSSREKVTTFLQAYFKENGIIDEGGIRCNATSEKLARDILQLLWGIGIKASIDNTSVKIHSEDILLFKDTNNCIISNEYLTIKKIENGKKIELYDLHVPGSHSFVANSVINHNSGKTATAAMIGTYVEHVLLTIALNQDDGRLSTYFGLLPKQPFEVTFIASTEVQSNDTIWAYYRSFRQDSPWFKRYVTWVKKLESKQETPVGMERWKYQETIREIENGHIGVKFNSKNSNSSGLAGRTRIASFIDELCRFKQTESSMGADEAYRVMENSLRTTRSAVLNRDLINWLGLVVSISSPISVDDKGMELLYQSKDIKSMYSAHYATWEFNPDEKREYYDEAFEKDPVGTERDFGARPPLAANPLIINPEKFELNAVDAKLKPTAELEIIPFIDKTGQRYHRAQMTVCQLMRDTSRYIVFDAGQNFDSFAGTCGHLEIKQLPDGNVEYVTVVDWVLRILPTNDMEVWFDSCVDIVKFQLDHQKIARVEFDRWNSVTLIQQIRNLGVFAEQKSIKPDDYIKFVADGHMGRIKLLPEEEEDARLDPPFKSASAIGIYELKRLERSIDDKRIYNPRKGKKRGYNSDDVAVVLVHLHKLCQDSQIMPQGAKLRSREARLKRETVGSEQWQFGGSGTLFSPGRLNVMNRRRW